MKNRIEKIIRAEGISSSKFAEEIGVQRSSISHILSGRNNASLDVIQRILRKFPNIKSDWLVLGVGDMSKPSNIEQNLFFENENELEKEETINMENEVESTEDNIFTLPNTPIISPNTANISKKIVKMLIFYSDNSFEELRPS